MPKETAWSGRLKQQKLLLSQSRRLEVSHQGAGSFACAELSVKVLQLPSVPRPFSLCVGTPGASASPCEDTSPIDGLGPHAYDLISP